MIALVLGYLVGSIVTAFVLNRFGGAKDVRQSSGGYVRGVHTHQQVQVIPTKSFPVAADISHSSKICNRIVCCFIIAV